MRLNTEAIQIVIDTIKKAEPERIKMNQFLQHGQPLCQTAACIAGWTALALLRHPAFYWGQYFGPDAVPKFTDQLLPDIENEAATALGLSWPQREELFFMSIHDPDFRRRLAHCLQYTFGIDRVRGRKIQEYSALSLFDHLSPVIRKEAAINVLTILKNTGTVDWVAAIRRAGIECGWLLVKENYQRREEAMREEIERLRELNDQLRGSSNGNESKTTKTEGTST